MGDVGAMVSGELQSYVDLGAVWAFWQEGLQAEVCVGEHTEMLQRVHRLCTKPLSSLAIHVHLAIILLLNTQFRVSRLRVDTQYTHF